MSKAKTYIAVFNLNWLGDILFSIPSLKSLKDHFPDSHLACIVPTPYRDLLQTLNIVDEVIAISDKSLLGKWRLLRELKKRKWDKGYLFHRSRTRARLFEWAQISERIGYRTKNREVFLTQAIEEPSRDIHKMDYISHLIKSAGVPLTTKHYFFTPPKMPPISKKPYIVFHPGSNWHPKRWPTRYYAELGNLLTTSYDIDIAITGTAEDRPLAKAIQSQLNIKALDLTGKTGLPELGSICQQSVAVVAGDTGPMHLAAASGAHVIAIYGPTSPLLNGPRAKQKATVIWENPGCKTYPCENSACEHPFILNKVHPQRIFDLLKDPLNA